MGQDICIVIHGSQLLQICLLLADLFGLVCFVSGDFEQEDVHGLVGKKC